MSEIGQNFIAGSWHNGHTNVEKINPSDIEDVIGHYAQVDCAPLDTALEAARRARRNRITTGLEACQKILRSIGKELIARRFGPGTLLSREEGKPLAGEVGEVLRARQFLTYLAASNAG